MFSVKIKQFEGPLDLLLQLIEDRKLEITELSLAEVTEQYLRVLQETSHQQVSTDELADFLVVAARLLLIKSRALLPFLHWDDEDDQSAQQLAVQLKMYKEYFEASKSIARMVAGKHYSFVREKLLTSQDVGFAPPPSLTAQRMATVFAEVIYRLEPLVQLPTEVMRRTINIQEKIQLIRERIYQNATTHFSDILKHAKDRTEVVVSFLALLELIKQKIIVVKQDNVFAEIVIEKV